MKPKNFFSNFFASLRIDSIIKRKISLAKILCLTISRLGYEFVIHVDNEYDYRYSSTKSPKNNIKFKVFVGEI